MDPRRIRRPSRIKKLAHLKVPSTLGLWTRYIIRPQVKRATPIIKITMLASLRGCIYFRRGSITRVGD
jgi:hypothetical protein